MNPTISAFYYITDEQIEQIQLMQGFLSVVFEGLLYAILIIAMVQELIQGIKKIGEAIQQ